MKQMILNRIEKIKKILNNFFTCVTKKDLIKYIIVCLLIVPCLLLFNTLAKYLMEKVTDNYLLSKHFYFTSEILETSSSYTLNDWDGVSNYNVTVDINNFIDELRWTKEDIHYTVLVTCNPNITGNVNCTSNNGIITYNSTGGTTNNINITLVNNNSLNFAENDYVDMNTTITSTSPYRKQITGSFRIYVKPQIVKYTIDDTANQNYLNLNLSNNSNENKTITLEWTYNVLSVDNNNEYVKNAILNDNARVYTVDGIDYVNSVTIAIPKKEVISIKFYKEDITQNYTYPIINQNSIITIS